MTQYIECKFPGSERAYSYGNNGDPVKVGDMVNVTTRTGIAAVEVTGILDGEPQLPAHVQLKFINGLAEGQLPE